jgi:hypothetical protein
MKFLPFFLVLLFLHYSSDGQHCGTEETEAHRKLTVPGYRERRETLNRLINETAEQLKTFRTTGEEPVYTIPVVVHIIHNNSSGRIGGIRNTNISDDQVLTQIQVLNEDFRRKPGTNGFNNDPAGADTKIEFCLATRDPEGNPTTGIVRKYFNKLTWTRTGDEQFMKSLSCWPTDKYLNIWVADLADDGPYALLGYSTYPSAPDSTISGMGDQPINERTDGVAIDYINFGRVSALREHYDKGRTATHEVGHFLGLYHIWGDEYCGNDYVDDTPADKISNTTKTCSDSSNCDPENPWNFTKDMVNNYMDYSYDRCMNIFTIGQKLRMRATIQMVPARRALLNSPGCCGSGYLAPCPLAQDFESDDWVVYNPGLNNFKRTSERGRNSAASFCFSPSGILNRDTISSRNFGYLISPYMYLQNNPAAQLSFDFAYAAENPESMTDSLVVSVQANCGGWIPVKYFAGNELITTSHSLKNQKDDGNEWKTFTIPLSEIGGKTVGRVRFEYYSVKGHNLYIDNINIFETRESITVTPYPNPVIDLLNLKILFEGYKNLQLQIYSSLGALVWENSAQNTLSTTMQVNTGEFAEGIYYIKVTSDDEGKTISRFIKMP